MTILERAEPPPGHEARGATGDAALREPRPFRFGLRDHLINLGFWTLFGAVTAAFFLSNDYDPTGRGSRGLEALAWFIHAYLWAALTPVIFWLVWRFRAGRAPLALRILLLGAAALGIALVVSIARDHVWHQVLDFPPDDDPTGALAFLLGRVRPIGEPVTSAAIVVAAFVREHLLESHAREERTILLQARAAESEAHAAQLQAQLARARLAVLRSQLNPHFLFNTLNALSTLVDDDPRGAQRMIARLSELLRFALEAREEEEIPLHQELMLTQRYLEILEIRYAGRLTTRVGADPEVRDALVPNLILQPLVENAMKHGVGKAGGRGSIEVDVRRAGGSLVLTVIDSGAGQGANARAEPGMEGSGTGLGLHNTRARLRELYGSEQRLRLAPTPEGGMIAEIVLPFHAQPGDGGGLEPAPVQEGAHA